MSDRPLLLTPNELRAEIKMVNNMIMGLKKIYDFSLQIEPDERDNFNAFVNEWTTYTNGLPGIKDSSGLSVGDFLLSLVRLPALPESLKLMVLASWDKLQEFKTSANRWRNLAIDKGARLKDIERGLPPPLSKKSGSAVLFSIVPWWAWLLGGGFLLWKISPLKTAERVKVLVSEKKGFKKR